ncbi:MAG TPA: hypothetical protein DEP48_01980 [Persephonella sp.]|uniref:Putative lipoprotein n=1 Tax=Persephonella marina (strain DSM 14350 / EX-H1) TaxID=123214 RepID=C0QRR5_PERMH|nr:MULTISPECIES: cupredoxin domain-containing protein [Persephonella]ACO04050.1 putative lipoprotein [Persephonella marina EX-H1]HCB69106.1 hypothetical protein [Persephonella sp.]
MRKIFLTLVSFSFIFLTGCTKTEDQPDVIVDIEVSKEGYRPDKIYLNRGDVVLFRVKAVDEGIGDDYSQEYYGHCFYILPPYDVMLENIKKGETKQIKLKMIYPGEFIFTCPYCSGVFPTKGTIYVR